jgi:ABC-type multidrug transport system fused ATPase/permease subunit
MSAFALATLGPSLQASSEGTAALEGLYKTIEESSKIEPQLASDRPPTPTVIIESIELQNVSFRYPTRPDVLADNALSVSIKAGQKVALVGESGSGKSALVSLLERV